LVELLMVSGDGEIDTVGAGTTVTWADAVALPLAPVHVREKVLFAVQRAGGLSAGTRLRARPSPRAVQDVAFVEDQGER